MKFKKGDKVVMTDCIEADHYKDKVWECASDSFKDASGNEVVYLEGSNGYFDCDCLFKKEESN